jgi:CO/xanthine dehydrogenase Mo-binding subunit
MDFPPRPRKADKRMEAEIACPYCGEPIALWLNEDEGRAQSYVEDCSVCCRPLQVLVSVDDEGEASARVLRLDE